MNDVSPSEALDMYESGEISGSELAEMFSDIFPDYDEIDDDE